MKDSINYIVLVVVGSVIAGATGWVWNHTERLALKAATLYVGTLLVIPYFLQYDLMILSIPLVLLAYDCMEYRSRPVDVLLLLIFWGSPLLDWILVNPTDIHILPFILMASFIWVIVRIKNASLETKLSCQFLATWRRKPENQAEKAKINALN